MAMAARYERGLFDPDAPEGTSPFDHYIYVIASDGHPGTRDHTLALGFVLAQRAGASSVQAWRLTQANPRFLLTHGIPQAPSPVAAPTARSLDVDRLVSLRDRLRTALAA